MRRWLRKTGWPDYDCECCVGQEYWRGCYCAYYDAYLPYCHEPPLHAKIARSVWKAFYGQISSI